jgi:hypothetical protein
MDIQQLKEHTKYCYEIDDVPALFIIFRLLPTEDDSNAILSKRDLWLAYRNFVGSKIDQWDDDQKRQLRQMEIAFDVSISLLEKKGVLSKDRRNEYFMLALDYPPEHYDEKDFDEINDICKKRLDSFSSKDGISISPKDVEELMEKIISNMSLGKKPEKKHDFDKAKKDYKIIFRDDGEGQTKDSMIWWDPGHTSWKDLTWNSVRDSKTFPKAKEEMESWLEKRKLRDSLDEINDRDFQKWIQAIGRTKRPSGFDARTVEKTKSSRLERFDKLSEKEKIKAEIAWMIDGVEKEIRDLLDSKGFAPTKKWGLGSSENPSDLRKRLDEMREKKREDALKEAIGDPKILTANKEYLNAATLGELIEIMRFVQKNSKEFDDVFDEWKEADFYLQKILAMRNKRYHNDEQITWNEDMYTKTKHITDEIVKPIARWQMK